eukprot:15447106-Alexandrium_andersonii.AAC.1
MQMPCMQWLCKSCGPASRLPASHASIHVHRASCRRSRCFHEGERASAVSGASMSPRKPWG